MLLYLSLVCGLSATFLDDAVKCLNQELVSARSGRTENQQQSTREVFAAHTRAVFLEFQRFAFEPCQDPKVKITSIAGEIDKEVRNVVRYLYDVAKSVEGNQESFIKKASPKLHETANSNDHMRPAVRMASSQFNWWLYHTPKTACRVSLGDGVATAAEVESAAVRIVKMLHNLLQGVTDVDCPVSEDIERRVPLVGITSWSGSASGSAVVRQNSKKPPPSLFKRVIERLGCRDAKFIGSVFNLVVGAIVFYLCLSNDYGYFDCGLRAACAGYLAWCIPVWIPVADFARKKGWLGASDNPDNKVQSIS